MPFCYRTNARYKPKGSRTYQQLPAIITETGLVISHLRYLSENSFKSISWKKESVSSVIFLMQYINAYEPHFDSSLDLLKSFNRTLLEGTVDPGTRADISKLYWQPRRPSHVKNIIQHITKYTDYLSERKKHSDFLVNPFREASNTEARLNWCAFYHKKNNAFLGYLYDNEKAKRKANRVRAVQSPSKPMIQRAGVNTKRFPEDKFEEFLGEGFVTSYGEPDYKTIAMTSLMHFGGLRISELFHIYIGDIVEHEGEASVRVYHPQYGASPESEYVNRFDFLKTRYSLSPRNLISGKLHAGWKSPLLSDDRYFFEVQFYPTKAATLFWEIWEKYLRHQRQDPDIDKSHPYAFTNNFGEPDTIANFRARYNRALERVGLIADKHSGTSPHAHRHSYGYRLAELGMTQMQIQKCMHHKSPNSCLVYIEPSENDIRKMFSDL